MNVMRPPRRCRRETFDKEQSINLWVVGPERIAKPLQWTYRDLPRFRYRPDGNQNIDDRFRSGAGTAVLPKCSMAHINPGGRTYRSLPTSKENIPGQRGS
jgi:hypothetical protein